MTIRDGHFRKLKMALTIFESCEKNIIISRQTVNERKLEENCFNVKFAEVE